MGAIHAGQFFKTENESNWRVYQIPITLVINFTRQRLIGRVQQNNMISGYCCISDQVCSAERSWYIRTSKKFNTSPEKLHYALEKYF